MIEPVIRVRNLCKRFGAVVACDDVSLNVVPGEIHALIGPNGAGKSTLIKQITGLLRQDSGQVYLDQTNISNMSVAQRANAGVAQSFQVSMIIPEFSALQNVMLAVEGNSGSIYRFFGKALKQKSLVDKARFYLDQGGLLARASMVAQTLSHGERRQLELCMALALEPKAFVLDEPMAGVGAAGSKAMIERLAALKLQAPILLVEHDMDAVFALADRISVLVYGRIIATGSVEQIRSNAEVRDAYMGNMDPDFAFAGVPPV